jgi:hypothetical protein
LLHETPLADNYRFATHTAVNPKADFSAMGTIVSFYEFDLKQKIINNIKDLVVIF